MTENKKKTTKKEVVDKNEDVIKPVKKNKIKDSKEKLIEEAFEEIELPEEEINGLNTEMTDDQIEEEDFIEEEKDEIDDESFGPDLSESDEEEITGIGSETEKTDKEKKREKDLTASFAASNEDFDWESFENDELRNSPKHKEYEALYDETLSTVAVDEVVQGTVIQMTAREVVINIGYKSEAVVSLNEFRYNPGLKVGDTVEVYVESQEDKRGQLLLSHKKARAINSWDRVNAALENDEIITGYIKCRTKGGMIVDVFGIEAFLPGSQIDVKLFATTMYM
jgi:small subunit ribosomal protein S1